jgi:hypothetical protein
MHDHVRTVARQAQRDRAADAAAGTGDERALAGQCAHGPAGGVLRTTVARPSATGSPAWLTTNV